MGIPRSRVGAEYAHNAPQIRQRKCSASIKQGDGDSPLRRYLALVAPAVIVVFVLVIVLAVSSVGSIGLLEK